MANIIEKMREQQLGYDAAKSAIEKTKPHKVAIEKKMDGDDKNIVTVIYDPTNDTIDICLNAICNVRYERRYSDLKVADAKLIIAALSSLFEEG